MSDAASIANNLVAEMRSVPWHHLRASQARVLEVTGPAEAPVVTEVRAEDDDYARAHEKPIWWRFHSVSDPVYVYSSGMSGFAWGRLLPLLTALREDGEPRTGTVPSSPLLSLLVKHLYEIAGNGLIAILWMFPVDLASGAVVNLDAWTWFLEQAASGGFVPSNDASPPPRYSYLVTEHAMLRPLSPSDAPAPELRAGMRIVIIRDPSLFGTWCDIYCRGRTHDGATPELAVHWTKSLHLCPWENGSHLGWRHYLLQAADGQAVACFSLFFPRSSSVAQLADLTVAPEARSGGLGTLLLGHAITLARELGASNLVLSAAAKARGLYARMGWEEHFENVFWGAVPSNHVWDAAGGDEGT
ncbi:acyl-CoA N-acyltransferase [Hyaloraphidium curvatum]|nr:acyl-CoA N-acyltransferase [Hyaloraphidium curvatum]